MKLSGLKIDSAKAEQGEWVRDIPDCGDLELKVRDPRNADARRLRQRLVTSVPRNRIRNGRIDPAEADKIDTRILVDTVLIDWKGLTNEDGSELPYSRETASTLLADPDMRPLRDAVAYAAGMVGETAAEQTEEDRGKLIASLRWQFEWGESAEWLEDAADEDESFRPEALEKRPELPAHLAFTWTAFMDLSGDRQMGFGSVGAIPFTAIDRYAIRFGVEGDEFERFFGLIRAMDAEWRKMSAKKPGTDA